VPLTLALPVLEPDDDAPDPTLTDTAAQTLPTQPAAAAAPDDAPDAVEEQDEEPPTLADTHPLAAPPPPPLPAMIIPCFWS
jgi:hypothetical protein